jgi:hypothetical protein
MFKLSSNSLIKADAEKWEPVSGQFERKKTKARDLKR